MDKTENDIKKLRRELDLLVEIVIKQSQVLLSIQRRLLDCERYRLKLETKKIDELISHHLQSKEPDNRDVF